MPPLGVFGINNDALNTAVNVLLLVLVVVWLALVFWTVMSLAGLITEGLFQLTDLIPGKLRGDIAAVHLGWNYTTILNVVALVAFGYLYYLYKNANQYGGGTDYAKDPVCGMTITTIQAANVPNPPKTAVRGRSKPNALMLPGGFHSRSLSG